MKDSSRKSARAWTLVEIIVVLGVLALLASILLAYLAKAKVRGPHVNCGNNLRQDQIAFYIWATDNNDLYASHQFFKRRRLKKTNAVLGGAALGENKCATSPR